jgi:hypothetical protein
MGVRPAAEGRRCSLNKEPALDFLPQVPIPSQRASESRLPLRAVTPSSMTNTQTLLTFLFLAAMFAVGVSYYSTRQKMLSMRRELDMLQARARSAHACSVLRNERARCHLELQALEAEISASERTALSAEQIKMVEFNRTTIKNSVEALKRAGDWLGLPFDLEWVDMLERLPHLDALYRASLDHPVPVTDIGETPSTEPKLSTESASMPLGDTVVETTALDANLVEAPAPDHPRTS